MDSSESVNSELNGASTCVTYADWACVCVCVCECVCLYALPAVWVPLPQPQLTCPASSLLTRLLDKQGRWGETARGWGKGGKGGRGLEWGLLTMPVSQGTRSVVAAFHTNRQHPLAHTVKITENKVAGVFFFFPFETGSLKPHNTDTIQNDKKKNGFRQNGEEFLALWQCLEQVLQRWF